MNFFFTFLIALSAVLPTLSRAHTPNSGCQDILLRNTHFWWDHRNLAVNDQTKETVLDRLQTRHDFFQASNLQQPRAVEISADVGLSLKNYSRQIFTSNLIPRNQTFQQWIQAESKRSWINGFIMQKALLTRMDFLKGHLTALDLKTPAATLDEERRKYANWEKDIESEILKTRSELEFNRAIPRPEWPLNDHLFNALEKLFIHVTEIFEAKSPEAKERAIEIMKTDLEFFPESKLLIAAAVHSDATKQAAYDDIIAEIFALSSQLQGMERAALELDENLHARLIWVIFKK